MPSSLQERVRRILPYALLLGVLPLAGDATNNIACCQLATSYASSLFGGGNGDEDFFTVPAGSSNLVVLFGNSSTMLDFPSPLPFPTSTMTSSTSQNSTALDALGCKALGLDSTLTGSTSNCSFGPGTSYLNTRITDTNNPAGTVMTASQTPPFDNGVAGGTSSGTTRLVNDAPPWGLPSGSGYGANGTCTALTAKGIGTCLFAPAHFYYYRTTSLTDLTGFIGNNALGDAGANSARSWSTANAYEWITEAGICTDANTDVPTTNQAACQTALTTKGYYLYRVGTSASNSYYAALFAGWFLNVYPPKYVMARKIVKNLAMVDTDRPSPLDKVRIALAVLKPKTQTGGHATGTSIDSTNDGGTLVVPLGPNCSVISPAPSDMTTPRQTLVNALNNGTTVSFGSGSIYNQLAETLYDIGQYYTSHVHNGTTDVYYRMFGSNWVNTNDNWLGTSAGSIAASWAQAPTVSTSRQDSLCWRCQQSSVVIVTDGLPKYDNNLPSGVATADHAKIMVTASDGSGDFRRWTNGKIACSGCGSDLAPPPVHETAPPNLLHKVAAFLYQNDLRTESSGTYAMTGLQNVATYTVSFGIARGSAAETLLQKTAELGGGTFVNASDPDELMQAMYDAAIDVTARATGFSVAATPTLQTSASTHLLLARFRPAHSPGWEGHLTRFRVFNEFAEGCDATRSADTQVTTTCTTAGGNAVSKNPNLNEDEVSGKSVCTGVFILDADCDTVIEDDNGDFKKATLDGTTHQFVAGTEDAAPYWDSGSILSHSTATHHRSAAETGTDRRKIYTIVDSNDDGTFTPADDRVELSTTLATSSAANWTRLKAALGVDVTYCTTLFGRMGVLNASASFNLTTNQATALDECAKQLIWYIRGYDVLDEDDDGCGGPDFPSNATSKNAVFDRTVTPLPNCPTNGEERDRDQDGRGASDNEVATFWKLGDIFHSSPVLVKPPATTFLCDLALDSQCVATIHSPQAALTATTQTPMDEYTLSGGRKVWAYDKYRIDKATRKRVALVGANDGMLHAFDAGSAITGSADAAGNYQFDAGTGEELWAFVPPDLLPKLKNAPLEHGYFVDGDTMVRDVWVDGSGTSTTLDGKKQSDEFHTVAIMSERAGGTEYVALDLTDPADPQFRWMYPQPCSLDASMVGQSWTGFAPRPPPIGPVKIKLTGAGGAGTQDPLSRGFEERWIAMINGGYDPSLTRGRGIWMMDAWSGARLWRFTNDELQDLTGSGDSGMWPVPSSVGLLDIGAGDQPKLDSDGFFDTATWGDIGGQLYVARFNDPDPANWAAARAFEEQRSPDDKQHWANRSEFYLMTGNTVDPATGRLHTYLGSGNRERLLQSGAQCSPDNIYGCMVAGCNTDVTAKYDYGSCSYTVKVHSNNTDIKQDRSNLDNTGTLCTEDDAIACNAVNIDFKVETVCGGWKPVGGSFHASLTCDASGTCSSAEKVQKGNTAPATHLTDPRIHNRFYGIWAFGGAGRMFDNPTEAATFDANRFTDIAYTGTACTGPTPASCRLANVTYAQVDANGAVTCADGAASCSAGQYSPGWFYEYGRRSACSLGSGCDAADWTDEKTASGAGILSSCVIWNSFRPVAGTSTTACSNTSGSARNYAYLADYLSGVPTKTCGVALGGTSGYARASMSTGIAPPNDWVPVVTHSKTGGTAFQQTQFPAGGTPQAQQVGVGGDTNQSIYWLEVPRQLHGCRHADATQCD